MSSYDPVFATALPVDLWSTADAAAAMRATLQLPQLLRFQGARSALFTASVLMSTEPAARASAMTGLGRALEGYGELQTLLERWDRTPRLHPDARAILAEVVTSNPNTVLAVGTYGDRVRQIYGTLNDGAGVPSGVYDVMMGIAYNVFNPAMQDLEACMQEEAGKMRAELDAAASDARQRAMDARARIEGIARTVRLISLNARVEAARAGQAGRTFGIIAEEIKSLSEQTETVSAELGLSVDEIMESFRAF